MKSANCVIVGLEISLGKGEHETIIPCRHSVNGHDDSEHEIRKLCYCRTGNQLGKGGTRNYNTVSAQCTVTTTVNMKSTNCVIVGLENHLGKGGTRNYNTVSAQCTVTTTVNMESANCVIVGLEITLGKGEHETIIPCRHSVRSQRQ